MTQAYDAARSGAIVTVVDDAVVRLSGGDARRFAAGMFTNDVARLRPGQGNRHALCDDRGRIGGLLSLSCVAEDTFVAVLDGLDAEAFASRYAMYVIIDDVVIEPVAPAVVTLQGPEAAAVLAAAGLPVPEGHATPDGRVLQHPRYGVSGFDVVGGPELVDALVGAGAVAAGRELLEVLRVEAGRVRWAADGAGKQLPHELALEAEVLCFTKGCYLGQEVINRVDVKGQVRRRLVGVELDRRVPSRTPVLADGAEVGELRTVVESPRFGPIALAVLRRPWCEPGHTLEVAGSAARTVATPWA